MPIICPQCHATADTCPAGFQRVEAIDAEEHVSFEGRTIGSSGDVTACPTPKGNIAVAGKGQSRLYVYEDYEILIAERGDAGRAAEMVAAVARALGRFSRSARTATDW